MAAATVDNEGESVNEVLLESTFEIKNQRYAVKLTRNDIEWNAIGTASGPNNEPFIKTGFSQLQQLFYESNTPDKVYYQPVSQTDPDERPVLLLPMMQNSANLLSCCSKSCQESVRSSFCNLCGRPIKNENKRLPLREIFAVVRGDCREGDSLTSSDENHKCFTIWSVGQSKKYTWVPCQTVFSASDVNIASRWLNVISDIISQSGFNRPKSLLVFINPVSGKQRAVKAFREKVAPLFQLAKITAHVMQTERRYHARDILQTYNLHDVDGVVSVGGDGLFAEVVDGLLTRTMKEDGTDLITADTNLLQPRWRIGIIPAGSTDTVSYSTQGINDPVTSALHIILGDSLALDVGAIFHNKQLLRYNISFFGYGFYGDCVLDSEQNRWMGPKRYDWAGFKKVMTKRTYTGEISFLLSSDKESHPRDGTACKAGCLVCRSVTDAIGDGSRSFRRTNSSSSGDNGGNWQTVRGRFVAVNSILMSCRCRYALEGPAPAAHLGNGCSDLVLVHDCSRLQYVQHLYRCTIPSADQFEFPFIQVFRITRFKFRLIAGDDEEAGGMEGGRTRDGDRLHARSTSSTSVWNCDGEVVDEPTVEYIIHPQLIQLFARGIEDHDRDQTTGCSCW